MLKIIFFHFTDSKKMYMHSELPHLTVIKQTNNMNLYHSFIPIGLSNKIFEYQFSFTPSNLRNICDQNSNKLNMKYTTNKHAKHLLALFHNISYDIIQLIQLSPYPNIRAKKYKTVATTIQQTVQQAINQVWLILILIRL